MKKHEILSFTLILSCVAHGRAVNFWEFFIGPRLGSQSAIADAKTTEQIVNSYGYRLDTHLVASETGHILTLHRIPPKNRGGAVAFVHHGLFGSSDTWLLRGFPHDLAYLLVEAGYDVWLFNIRGSTHSRKHERLDPDRDAEYWDFGIEDIGYYDVPVTIDYILNVTNKKDLFLLGYSIGSSAAFITCSMRPEYNDKIRLFLALGPLTNVKHKLSSVHKITFLLSSVLGKYMETMNIYEIFPRRAYVSKILEMACEDGSSLQPLCLSLIFALEGEDFKQFNTSFFPTFLHYYPAGTSLKILMDVTRYYLLGEFRRNDYGNANANLLHYNTSVPPLYDLSKVTAPVSLHYGEGDLLVTEEDVVDLARRLPNVVGKFKIPYKHFNHLDFVLANNARSILYEDLLHLMEKYRRK